MVSRTEDEELALVREWWQRNGKSLLSGVILALIIVFGWQFWEKSRTERAEGASMLFQQLLETALTPAGEVNAAAVVDLAGKLKKDYSGTHYAQYAALFVAKLAVDSGRLDEAVTELRGIVSAPADAVLAELARQRLARVLSAQGKTEAGLELLEGDTSVAFAASREELKGDLLLKLGRADEAHAAYDKAKGLLAEDAAVGDLQMKLDNLARGDA